MYNKCETNFNKQELTEIDTTQLVKSQKSSAMLIPKAENVRSEFAQMKIVRKTAKKSDLFWRETRSCRWAMQKQSEIGEWGWI
ncbi:hypothetical protein C1H46_045822 [Malus baccata]|uniref:Uncharacterized protein n=1 Tax=Malus baccata TaxID=106549 RepID=A0A540K2Z7_MALBA|nr:hypothetical protein C1H46_045822 [Malus baccata]